MDQNSTLTNVYILHTAVADPGFVKREGRESKCRDAVRLPDRPPGWKKEKEKETAEKGGGGGGGRPIRHPPGSATAAEL